MTNDTGEAVPSGLSKARASELIDKFRGESPRLSQDDA